MKIFVFNVFLVALWAANVAAHEQDVWNLNLENGMADTIPRATVADSIGMKKSLAAGCFSLSVAALPDGAHAAQRARVSPYRFKPLQIVVPVTLLGVGLIGCESDWLKYQNKEIRDELQENIDGKFTMDDFSQYAPMVATYVVFYSCTFAYRANLLTYGVSPINN